MNDIIGFYGKLPIIGDFVGRRLPNDFTTPWDAWLQSAITASREVLGVHWLKSYLSSPIWRFLLAPGVCGDKAVAGIIMPSLDRVGRHFPLTVAIVFEQAPLLPYLFTEGKAWFEQIEDAALTALEGDLDINSFDQLIQSIPIFSVPEDLMMEQTSRNGKKVFYTAMENNRHITDAFVGINTGLLTHFMPGYSLWSNEGSEYVQAALLACEGLPTIGSYARFLNSRLTSKDALVNTQSVNSSLTGVDPEATVPTPQDLSSVLMSDNHLLIKPCWHSWAITNTGKHRKHNEDSLLNRPEAGLWVIADGMGGHKAGDVASQLIITDLQNLKPSQSLEDYITEVKLCLQSVNTKLRKLSAKVYDNQVVGSTVVALVAHSQHCAVLWAGDSRLYRLRNNVLQQLTQDHCANDEQASTDWSLKSSNIITRAVGADDSLKVAVEIIEVLPGDVFLLSSDGLDKEMSFKEIEHTMQKSPHAEIANTLVNEVLSRGARDNVSVILITTANL